MKILYVLSLLSFLALLWAALSITRHIRRDRARLPLPPELEPLSPASPHSRTAPVAELASSGAALASSMAATLVSEPAVRSDWSYREKESGELNGPATPTRGRQGNNKVRRRAQRIARHNA